MQLFKNIGTFLDVSEAHSPGRETWMIIGLKSQNMHCVLVEVPHSFPLPRPPQKMTQNLYNLQY